LQNTHWWGHPEWGMKKGMIMVYNGNADLQLQHGD